MAKSRKGPVESVPYEPPQRMLVLCKVCEGALVLYKIFKDGRMVDVPGGPVTPVAGMPHRCAGMTGEDPRPGSVQAVAAHGRV